MHCFFDTQTSKLIVLDGKQKYQLSVKESVWQMLCEAMQQVYIHKEIFKKYEIEQEIVTVICAIGVLIVCDTKALHGDEARGFYSLTQQPNKIDFDLTDEAISNGYVEAEQARKQQLYYPLLNKEFVRCTHDYAAYWKQNNGMLRGSTRKTSARNGKSIKPLLGYIQQYLLKKQGRHLPWGSAGGRYSVYGIIITQTDEVFVFHPLRGMLWYTSFPGISKAAHGILIPHSEYSWDGYQAMMVLACDPSRCFKKYGNRGLRYLMMESGALGCLLRNACAGRGYLEVGGWYEYRFAELMTTFSVFSDNRTQLFTHLLLFA